MFSRFSWSLVIVTGLLGSGAGIVLKQLPEPVTSSPAAPPEVYGSMSALPSSDVVPWADDVRGGLRRKQAHAQLLYREPFAALLQRRR